LLLAAEHLIVGRMTKLTLVQSSDVEPGRAGVLDAAGRLFRLKGFATTTVRDIAEAAGVLPGSLHYRFRTKESILLALMERGISSAEAAFRTAVAGSRHPIERLRAAIRAHVELLIGGDDATYVLLYEGRGLEGEARAAMTRLRDRYDALWDGLLYQAVGSGVLREATDVKLTRLMILGALNWIPQWFNPTGGKNPGEIADVFADIVLVGLLDERGGP